MALMTRHYTPQQLGNLNRRFGNTLGWKKSYHQVKDLLGITSTLPLPDEFAAAVASWQAAHPPLRTDGLLGPRTWATMRPSARRSASTLSPLPAWLLTSSKHRVKYDVPLRRQGTSPICWLACVAMMLSYRNRRPVATAGFTGGLDPRTTSIPNTATTIQQQYRFLEGAGFTIGPVEQGYPDEDYLAELLRMNGPLMLFHGTMSLWNTADATSNHAAVLTGIDTATDRCFANNPWGTKDQPLPTQTVLDAIGYMWTQHLSALIWLS